MGMDRLLERVRKGSGPSLRVSEVAEITGLSRSYIHRLIDDGTLTPAPHRIAGRTYLIPVQEAKRLAIEVGVL